MPFLHQLQILKKFTCIGGSCPQTCCANWNLPLADDDIDYYKRNVNVLGSFYNTFNFEKKCIRKINEKCVNLTKMVHAICNANIHTSFYRSHVSYILEHSWNIKKISMPLELSVELATSRQSMS